MALDVLYNLLNASALYLRIVEQGAVTLELVERVARVVALGVGRDRANLHKAKTRSLHSIYHRAVAVVACGQTYARGELHTKGLQLELRGRRVVYFAQKETP